MTRRNKQKEKCLNALNWVFGDKVYHLVIKLKYDLLEGHKKKAIENYKDSLYTLFSFYRNMIYAIDNKSSYIKFRELREGENYKSAYDTDTYTNWCRGVAIYKGVELPVFVDDYGMRDYVEYKNYLGETRDADFDADWDYAFERDTMLSYLLSIHTIKQCDKALDYIDNDKIFKNFF